MSSNHEADDVPALLTRMSRRPQRSTTDLTIASTADSSLTSAAMPTTSLPVEALISAAAAVQIGLRPGHNRHESPFCRESLGCGTTDPVAASRDDRHLACHT